MNDEIGYIKPREIVDEMEASYIDYAMSVIVSRALPDVRDGLKPVQRRILYAMHGLGLSSGSKFRKSAAVTGEVLGKYHPHGDASVYAALVRMAQDFSLRYPLVTGQGNFGSIDGDPPAAQRYTECKLSKIGDVMLQDITKNTVDYADNYDSTRREPTVLPAPVPQLLLNGSLGIAIGMATSIPSHNLGEVVDALIHLINNPKATTEDLFAFVQGPDFPTGGEIFDREEIINTYSQGRGPIVMRGVAEIQEKVIVVTEIPYAVNKSTLMEQLAKLVQDKKIDGVRDIRDESDRDGLRIVIELRNDAYPQKILNRLFKFTDLQKTFHLNMLALVDGLQPKTLSLADVLSHYIHHRQQVFTRRTQYDLDKAQERIHILEGLDKALTDIDKCIKVIRASKTKEDAKDNLKKTFKLSDIQALAILEIKLQQLAKMERDKIADELLQKAKEIKEYEALLKSPKKILKNIEKELLSVKKEYGDERKTKVITNKIGDISEEDLIPLEDTIITLTQGGYVKRINPSTYKIQKRGGKGMLGMKTLQEDIVEHLVEAKTHDSLLFFTDSGKVFRVKAYEIPEGTRVARGRGILNFLEISPQEKVLSIIPLCKDDEARYLVMATEKGIVKKTSIDEFRNIRCSGLIAINLKKGDLLKKVCKSKGEDEIILVSQKGQSIHFKENDVREMGRPAAGVMGISLKKGDKVSGMEIISGPGSLLVITEHGYGKKTDLKEYRLQKRGGTGIKTLNLTSKVGDLVAIRVLPNEDKDLLIISRQAQVIRTQTKAIPSLSRATQGVRLIRLDDKDSVASAICL
jgi:DNA gyrase subunit A